MPQFLSPSYLSARVQTNFHHNLMYFLMQCVRAITAQAARCPGFRLTLLSCLHGRGAFTCKQLLSCPHHWAEIPATIKLMLRYGSEMRHMWDTGGSKIKDEVRPVTLGLFGLLQRRQVLQRDWAPRTLVLTIAKMPQELQSDASLSALLKVPETVEQY